MAEGMGARPWKAHPGKNWDLGERASLKGPFQTASSEWMERLEDGPIAGRVDTVKFYAITSRPPLRP